MAKCIETRSIHFKTGHFSQFERHLVALSLYKRASIVQKSINKYSFWKNEFHEDINFSLPGKPSSDKVFRILIQFLVIDGSRLAKSLPDPANFGNNYGRNIESLLRPCWLFCSDGWMRICVKLEPWATCRREFYLANFWSTVHFRSIK